MLPQRTNSRLILIGILAASATSAGPMSASETTSYRMIVKDNIVSLRIPSGWESLPPDPGYAYLASSNQRQKITFYALPAEEGEFPNSRSEIAINRLKRLRRNVNRTGTSCLHDISKGPNLRLENGTPNASWMYRVIKPNPGGGTREIRYWTIVTRFGQLDYYLELRWEPDVNAKKDDQLTLAQQFSGAFEPICNTLRIDQQAEPLPVAILDQKLAR